MKQFNFLGFLNLCSGTGTRLLVPVPVCWYRERGACVKLATVPGVDWPNYYLISEPVCSYCSRSVLLYQHPSEHFLVTRWSLEEALEVNLVIASLEEKEQLPGPLDKVDSWPIKSSCFYTWSRPVDGKILKV